MSFDNKFQHCLSKKEIQVAVEELNIYTPLILSLGLAISMRGLKFIRNALMTPEDKRKFKRQSLISRSRYPSRSKFPRVILQRRAGWFKA